MMEPHQKQIIQQNFVKLTEGCNASDLLNSLERTEVFTSYQIRDIQRCCSEYEKSRKIFLDIQTRGPTAFERLIKALMESRQYPLVHLLDPENKLKEYTISQSRIRPFQAPNYLCENDTNKGFPQSDEIHVIPAVDFSYEHKLAKDNIAFYNTTSKNRGVVGIFNFYSVEQHGDRVGSLQDVRNLKSLFKQLHFKIIHHEDLTYSQFQKALKEFSSSPLLKDADIAMLFIMSHGSRERNQDYVWCSDGPVMPTSDIEEHFSNKDCPYMHNKPKIIVYEICRGPIKDVGVKLRDADTDGQLMIRNNTIHTFTDLLILHATIPEHAAHRDPEFGTWYIYWICMIFMKEAHHKDVATMIEMVQEKLKHERSRSYTMQSGESINRSFKKCYLNPGIYRENGFVFKFGDEDSDEHPESE